jgi:hypothetical protein
MTGNDQWGNNTADIFGQLDSARALVAQASYTQPRIAFMNSKTARLFANTKQIMDAKVLSQAFGINALISTLTSKPGNNAGSFTDLPPTAVLPFATLTYPQMDVYAYDQLYRDVDGDNTLKQVIPDGKVVVISNEFQGRVAYGSIRQTIPGSNGLKFIEATRVPKIWTDEDADTIKFRLMARPLAIPNDVLSWAVLDVGVGPATVTY